MAEKFRAMTKRIFASEDEAAEYIGLVKGDNPDDENTYVITFHLPQADAYVIEVYGRDGRLLGKVGTDGSLCD